MSRDVFVAREYVLQYPVFHVLPYDINIHNGFESPGRVPHGVVVSCMPKLFFALLSVRVNLHNYAFRSMKTSASAASRRGGTVTSSIRTILTVANSVSDLSTFDVALNFLINFDTFFLLLRKC